MVECVVCRYWSERLEETRAHPPDKSALKLVRRLLVSLRTHQFGACARRFPDLLKDLVKQEREVPDKAPDLYYDPARVRILTNSQFGEFEAVPTYELHSQPRRAIPPLSLFWARNQEGNRG